MLSFPLRFLRLMLETGSGVASNLGASAIDRRDFPAATMFIAAAAVLTAAKSTADYYLGDNDRREAEQELTRLVEKHGNIANALDAIATGRQRSKVISTGKAAELLTT